MMTPHDFDENGTCRVCKRWNREVGSTTYCSGNSNAVDAASRIREILLPISAWDREIAWFIAGFCEHCGQDLVTDGECHCQNDE